MNKASGVSAFFLLSSLALACGDGGLASGSSGGSTGAGQGGTNALGGTFGFGGAGAGGAVASGGSSAAGGQTSSVGGGKGGANTGGSAIGGKGGTVAGGGGTGGTICLPVACPTIACVYSTVINPDPCGCPSCADPDAGASKDAATDACLQLPCAYPLCGPGYVVSTPLCGCPTCVPADAGAPDTTVCPFSCRAITCASGTVPTSDACGCTTCTAVDAGTDTGKLDCVGLDECTCGSTKGCSVISDACYCPFPQCNSGGACFCGGGKFLGCAPATLVTCSAAKERVTTLCPQLKGSMLDSLCQQPDSACITKCLDDVTSCGEVSCSFCDGCDCATDPFMQCRAKCKSSLTQ